MQTEEVKAAFIQHGGHVGGTRTMLTEEVPHQTKPVPKSAIAKNEVRSFGARFTSEHMVHFEGRWRRVYGLQFLHGANYYILDRDNSRLTVSFL